MKERVQGNSCAEKWDSYILPQKYCEAIDLFCTENVVQRTGIQNQCTGKVVKDAEKENFCTRIFVKDTEILDFCTRQLSFCTSEGVGY